VLNLLKDKSIKISNYLSCLSIIGQQMINNSITEIKFCSFETWKKWLIDN
jgi:hypothetical protein